MNIKNFFWLVILAVSFLFSQCDSPQEYFQTPEQYIYLPNNQNYLIIEKIQVNESEKLPRYKYTTKDHNGIVILHLDIKFSIGDTVWVGKNN